MEMERDAQSLKNIPSAEEPLGADHRILEWPGLKRTTVLIEFQPPRYVQGHQPLDQATQSHIQPGLECLQEWDI